MQIEPWFLWCIFLVIGVGTFLLRFSFIWLFGRGKVRPEVQQVLRFVPAAVMAALAVPSIVFSSHGGFSWTNPRMLAGIVAAVVASRSRNVLLTITSGMVTFWLISYFFFP